MKYQGHYGGAPGIEPSFNILVDDETMTWVSVPPGHDVPKPFGPVYFPRTDGALNEGKNFFIMPSGRAEQR